MYKNNYSVKNSLKKLFLQRYERYLPTAFDESMSLLEKMNKLIQSQNALIDVVNTHTEFTSEQLERAFKIVDDNLANELKKFRDELDEQKRQYEEIRDLIHSDLLPDSVAQKLEEWLLNGTIEDLISNTIFPELMERMEEVENRLEDWELLDEVNITHYKHLVTDDGNWYTAIMTALNEAKQVTFPVGHYKTYPIESRLSGRSIVGRGNGTTFEFVRETPTGVVNGFRIDGDTFDMECETVRRITKSNIDNDNVLYLEKTKGLNVGDKIRVTSQRNALSFEDTGNDWLLGKPTNTQKVAFGEYAYISEVHDDHIVLETSLIYPQYKSSNEGEVDPAHDFSFVEKVNFVSDWLFKDFKVVDMVSGQVVRVDLGYNVIVDGVQFDDSNYRYGASGIFFGTNCLNCEVRDSSHFLKSNNNPQQQHWTNSLKLTGSQNCGFNGCKIEHSGQSVDLTFFDLSITNTNNYIENCKFMGSKKSSMTTHGGDYGTRITNNQFIGCRQGVSIRGRGGVISGNVFQGTSRKTYESYLSAGISLYQGGACDNLITGNTFKNYNTGIIQRDTAGSNGRIGYAGNTISNNIIIDCNIGIDIYKLYTGAVAKHDYRGMFILDNQIRLKNHGNGTDTVYGVRIGQAVRGVTVRGNMIKGIIKENRTTNSYGVYCEVDAQDTRVLFNTFMHLSYGVGHMGYASPRQFDDLKMHREGNEYIENTQNRRILGGVRPYTEDEAEGRRPWPEV